MLIKPLQVKWPRVAGERMREENSKTVDPSVVLQVKFGSNVCQLLAINAKPFLDLQWLELSRDPVGRWDIPMVHAC